MNDDNMTDDNMTDDNMTDDNMTDDNMTDEINIVVTGFGQFGHLIEENPAWSIAKSLPSAWEIPIRNRRPLKLKINVRSQPVRVAYQACHELMDEIYSGSQPVQLVMHIGVATSRPFYSTERLAHRDNYPSPDVDGKYAADATPPAYWTISSPELYTNVDIDDCLDTWRQLAPRSDLRMSNDAGHYICDYLFYCSLARQQHANNGKSPDKHESTAIFLHVPLVTDERSLQEGRSVALALISSVVLNKLDLKNERESHHALSVEVA